MSDKTPPHILYPVDRAVKKPVRRRSTAVAKDADLDERVQTHIGNQLKAIYDTIVNEPIPDRLLDLLKEVDALPKKRDDQG